MKKIFTAILTVAILLTGKYLIAAPAAAGSVGTLTLYFDDRIDMTGKEFEIVFAGQSADGGDVVSYNGKYLIASGVGAAFVRIDGEPCTVTVEKARISLIVIMGQSNAGNHFVNATSDVTCPPGTAYRWGSDSGAVTTEPTDYTQPSRGFHTPLIAELYAQSAAAGYPVKNVMIWQEGVTSKNGKSVTSWAASASDTSGTDATVRMINNCRAYYEARADKYEIVSSGVYWLQGETDLLMDPAIYTECFTAMWKRLKDAGMDYMAFLRLRRAVYDRSPTSDDLYYSASLSAQIKMINDTPEFYMATTVTENWVGDPSVEHTVDISNYITVMRTYGGNPQYSDEYGNIAEIGDGKLTTTMKTLYGSNNVCHYGKFGYGIIGADAAFNMYRALHSQNAEIVVTDTSGYADRAVALGNGEQTTVDIADLSDDLSFRAACGSTAGTLAFRVYAEGADITDREGLIIPSGQKYGAVSTEELRNYGKSVIRLTYTASNGDVFTAVCRTVNGGPAEQSEAFTDANGDGKINNKDVAILFRYVTGYQMPEYEPLYDFNTDGKIDNKDVTGLFRFVSAL